MVCLGGPVPAQEAAANTETDTSQETRRVVIRTLADGSIEVVGAEDTAEPSPREAADGDGLEALEAMAQRLRMADAAAQSLEPATTTGTTPRRTSPRSGVQSLGIQQRLRVPSAEGTGTADSAGAVRAGATATGTVPAAPVPCLANADVDAEVDPCEVARRIGRLQPCRTPKECDAYDAWRQQYGAPGLRAARPATENPGNKPSDKPKN